VSNVVSFLLVWGGVIESFARHSQEAAFAASFLAGVLYTSFFTNPIGVAVFIVLGRLQVDPFLVGAIAASGAVIGEGFMFEFLHGDRVEKIGGKKLTGGIMHRLLLQRPFYWLITLFGALIILSPFPDEVGIKLLQSAHVRPRSFFLLSYVLSFVGIAFLVLLGKMIQLL